jgi:hypothetical protein
MYSCSSPLNVSILKTDSFSKIGRSIGNVIDKKITIKTMVITVIFVPFMAIHTCLLYLVGNESAKAQLPKKIIKFMEMHFRCPLNPMMRNIVGL